MKRSKNYQKRSADREMLEWNMQTRGIFYLSLRAQLKKIDKPEEPITKTMLWYWYVEGGEDFPKRIFDGNPPVEEAPNSNRILITGTNYEIGLMNEVIRGLEAYRTIMGDLEERREQRQPSRTDVPQAPDSDILPYATNSQHPFELFAALRSLQEYLQGQHIKPRYCYSSQVVTFWSDFFGKERFLDDLPEISVPCAIIGTGFMRNYDCRGGSTVYVEKRLKEIADEWDIPIRFIGSWAL